MDSFVIRTNKYMLSYRPDNIYFINWVEFDVDCQKYYHKKVIYLSQLHTISYNNLIEIGIIGFTNNLAHNEKYDKIRTLCLYQINLKSWINKQLRSIFKSLNCIRIYSANDCISIMHTLNNIKTIIIEDSFVNEDKLNILSRFDVFVCIDRDTCFRNPNHKFIMTSLFNPSVKCAQNIYYADILLSDIGDISFKFDDIFVNLRKISITIYRHNKFRLSIYGLINVEEIIINNQQNNNNISLLFDDLPKIKHIYVVNKKNISITNTTNTEIIFLCNKK